MYASAANETCFCSSQIGTNSNARAGTREAYFNFILLSLLPVNKYMPKISNRNSRKRCVICSKLAITVRHNSDVNDVILLSLLLTFNILNTFLYYFYCWLWRFKFFTAVIFIRTSAPFNPYLFLVSNHGVPGWCCVIGSCCDMAVLQKPKVRIAEKSKSLISVCGVVYSSNLQVTSSNLMHSSSFDSMTLYFL